MLKLGVVYLTALQCALITVDTIQVHLQVRWIHYLVNLHSYQFLVALSDDNICLCGKDARKTSLFKEHVQSLTKRTWAVKETAKTPKAFKLFWSQRKHLKASHVFLRWNKLAPAPLTVSHVLLLWLSRLTFLTPDWLIFWDIYMYVCVWSCDQHMYSLYFNIVTIQQFLELHSVSRAFPVI